MTEKYDSLIETLEHINQVAKRLEEVNTQLLVRGIIHDHSKLGPEEKPLFDEMTPKLKELVYGSDEYKASLKALGPALEHHYKVNPHHPEYYENGINGMCLLDLIEMYCDWSAAVMRNKNGNLEKSIEINAKRFEMTSQLEQIFKNTYKKYEDFSGNKLDDSNH